MVERFWFGRGVWGNLGVGLGFGGRIVVGKSVGEVVEGWGSGVGLGVGVGVGGRIVVGKWWRGRFSFGGSFGRRLRGRLGVGVGGRVGRRMRRRLGLRMRRRLWIRSDPWGFRKKAWGLGKAVGFQRASEGQGLAAKWGT